MDFSDEVYFDEKKCKYNLTNDYNEYKSKYCILDSWKEIEENILNNWSKPKNIKVDSKILKKFDYKNHMQNQVKDIFKTVEFKYEITKQSLINSLKYIYEKHPSAIYVQIRNNKINKYHLIENYTYENPLYFYFKIKNKNNKSEEKKKWKNLGGVITTFEKKYKEYGITFYYIGLNYYINYLLKNNKIKDSDFIIVFRDRFSLKRNNTEPDEEIVGFENYEMDSKFIYSSHIPFIGFNYNDRYADIPFPTYDDIKRIMQFYTPPSCSNIYLEDFQIPSWENKKKQLVWRGSLTGFSNNKIKNPRLKLCQMSLDYPDIINAGLTKGGSFKGRKEINSPYIKFVNKQELDKFQKEYLNWQKQVQYKYIINIEGNVSAFRGSFLFSLESVVLWVNPTKHYLWFEKYLENYENCIFIKRDLSNLLEVINWLQNNDNKARKIAERGKKLYDTLLTKEAIDKYSTFILNSL